jgi:hypothetical protein
MVQVLEKIRKPDDTGALVSDFNTPISSMLLLLIPLFHIPIV